MYCNYDTQSEYEIMPKRTIKYVRALALADYLEITDIGNQERLYRLLSEQGYFWDAATQNWEQINEPADPPTQLVRVRIWTNLTKVKAAAHQVKTVLEQSGYELIEQSEPYPCRPPKQLESRIYLTFKQDG